ncbi:MAG: trypsin-like serine protease, partial [Myxococcales bacterium]|nr:trypsin-like serine protease [Myxococcales bacterium]
MLRSPLKTSCIVLALVMCSCVSEGDGDRLSSAGLPIVNGQREFGFPAVGALTVDGFSFCTGTLIAPDVVLTAAHCYADWITPNMRLSMAFGSNAGAPDLVVPISDFILHPSYNSQTYNNDAAILLLERAVDLEPMAINRRAMHNGDIGRSATFVGYGWTDYDLRDGGLKHSVQVPITQIFSSVFEYRGLGNTCKGDSGGPAFLDEDDELVLIGITSYGDERCEVDGYNQRVDVVLDFIDRYLDRTDPDPDPEPEPEPDPEDF